MSQHINFEGLTLTVENIDRSIEFYEGKLGLKVEHKASPDFALLRIGGDDGGTATPAGGDDFYEDPFGTGKAMKRDTSIKKKNTDEGFNGG